jgi:hypothetical protein
MVDLIIFSGSREFHYASKFKEGKLVVNTCLTLLLKFKYPNGVKLSFFFLN